MGLTVGKLAVFVFIHLPHTIANLEQSFRPYGLIRHSGKYLKLFNLKLNNSYGKFGFTYSTNISNVGQGILYYLGNLNYSSKTEIDFRKQFLANKLNNITVDKMYSYCRSTPLQTGEHLEINLFFGSDTFYTPIYLYSLALYEDQEGNLYDTQHLLFQNFINPIEMDTTEGKSWEKEKYSKYSIKEKNLLIKQLKKIKCGILNYMRK